MDKLRFVKAVFDDNDVIFTRERLRNSHDLIPYDHFCYECRATDATCLRDRPTIGSVEEKVQVNFAGTIISKHRHEFAVKDRRGSYTPLSSAKKDMLKISKFSSSIHKYFGVED